MRPKNKQVRIDSTDVQGPDSFVIVKSPSWGLMRTARSLTADGAVAETVGIDFAETMVRESVIDWNWTDDNGEPLPSPAQDKSVIERLTFEEVNFLIEKISGLVSNSSGNSSSAP